MKDGIVLLIVNLLLVFVGARLSWGWHLSRGRIPKDSIRARRLTIVIAIAAGLTSVLSYFPTFAELLEPRHTVMSYLQIENAGNNCVSATLILYPTDKLTDLQMVVSFDQPIKDHVVLRDIIHDSNMGVQARWKNSLSCEIVTPSADRDDALSFSIASDQRAIKVRGHDLSSFDRQAIAVTFQSDAFPALNVSGEATFDSLGNRLPADIILCKSASDCTKVLK